MSSTKGSGGTALRLIETNPGGELGGTRAVLFQDYERITEMGVVEPIFGAIERLTAVSGLEFTADVRELRLYDSDAGDSCAYLQLTILTPIETDDLLDLEEHLAAWIRERFPPESERLVVYLRRK